MEPITYLDMPPAMRSELLRDLDAIDWYRKCLEDKEDRRPVLGFREAKLGYDEAFSRVMRAIEGDASRDA